MRFNSAKFTLLGFGAALLVCTSALAENDALEEIVVTAQKREQSAQDVPIAIVAFAGNQLERLDLQSSADLTRLVPGLNVTGSFGGQLLTFSLRGVAQYDFSLHTEAPIAVYVDEAYLASQDMQNFPLFDVDQVEVLKGPQGTLFGHNATGGAIVIATRKPGDTNDGYARVTYGRFDQVKFEGAVGGRVTDTVSARVSVYSDKYGPYTKNVFAGDGLNGGGENNDDTHAGRIQLRYQPTDEIRLDLSVFGSRSTFGTSPYNVVSSINVCNASGQVVNSLLASPTETREAIGPNGVNSSCGGGPAFTRPVPGGDFSGYIVPGDPRFVEDKYFSSDNYNYSNMDGATAKFSWRLPIGTLTSVSDFKRNSTRLGLSFDDSPANIFQSQTVSNLEQLSEDVHLNGSTSRTRWVAGGYYLSVDEHTPVTGFVLPGLNLELRDSYRQYSDSAALYGQTEIDLIDKLTFTAGLRASRETKDFHYEDNLFTNSSVYQNGTFLANARLYDGHSNETLWGGRLELSYKQSDHLMWYAGYNRGTKGGGFNAPLGGSALVPDSQIPYKPEELSAYEAGFKSEWLGGTARLNGTAFYYNYHNYQGYKAIGTAEEVQNYRSTTKGFEEEFSILPVRGLTLSLYAAYTDMLVKDVDFLGIVADRRNVKTPPWTVTALSRYEWTLPQGRLSIGADAKFSGTQYNCICDFESTKIPAYTVGNAQLSYTTSSDRLEFSAFVNNFTDRTYKVVGFDFSGTTGSSLVGYGAPRWWGLTVQYRMKKD